MTAARRARAEPQAPAPRQSSELTVVKLGGSLAAGGPPLAWLDAVAAGAGRVVLVPGGGPFADQVRALQSRWAFSDETADRLAMLAMEQYGRVLVDLRPELVPADSEAKIRAALQSGQVPVWLPMPMARATGELPRTWAVTSDSLALWLANALGAARVVLVKSAAPPTGPRPAADLARAGLIDEAFPALLAAGRSEAWCLGPEESGLLSQALSEQAEPGTRILPDPD